MSDDALSFTLSLVDQISGPARGASSAVSALTGGFQKMAKGLDMLAPGMGSLVSTLIGVDGAIASVAVSLVESGFAMASGVSAFEASTRRGLQAVMGSAEGADNAMKMIAAVGEKSATSKEQLAAYAQALASSGLKGGELASQLRVLANVNDALGESVAARLQKVIQKTSETGQFKINAKDLIGTGVNEDQLAHALGLDQATFQRMMKSGQISAQAGMKALNEIINNGQVGQVAAEKANSLSAQWANFKNKTLPGLFDGVDFTPLIAPFKDLLHDFDQTTASGKTMHSAIVGALQGMVNAAATGIPMLKHGLEDIIIVALRVAIAIKPTYEAVKQFLETHQAQIVTAFKMLGIAVIAVVAGLAIFAAIGLVAFGVALTIVGAILALVAACALATVATVTFASKAVHALTGWASSALSAAGDFVSGIVQGIKNGTGAVVSAIENMASGAIAAFKAKLSISSPSKVMFEAGVNTAEGVALGIDAGAPKIASSMAAAAPGSDAVASKYRSNGAAGGKQVHITIAPGAVVIHGVADAEQLREVLPAELANVLERLALQSGL